MPYDDGGMLHLEMNMYILFAMQYKLPIKNALHSCPQVNVI